MDFRTTKKMALLAVAVSVAVIGLTAMADAIDEKRAAQRQEHFEELMAASPIPTYEEPTVIVTAEPTITGKYYPETGLDADLQDFIRGQCEEAGIDFEMVLALIMWEHRGHPDADSVSPTNDYGLMQINRINHQWLAEEYGLTDMTDPRQNIQAGLIILDSVIASSGNDPNKILMSYNQGPTGAANDWAQGITSSTYSRTIIEIMEDIKAGTYSPENFDQFGQYTKGA